MSDFLRLLTRQSYPANWQTPGVARRAVWHYERFVAAHACQHACHHLIYVKKYTE
jgi:hypothetical protein